jgi:hypothetical protein
MPTLCAYNFRNSGELIMRNALKGLSVLLLLLLTMGNRGCDFGDIDSVRKQANEGIAPYFPNVTTTVLPNDDMIIAYTCAQGTGDALTTQVAQVLPSLPAVQNLKRLRGFGWITGSHTYGKLALGFENSIIVYNVDSGVTTTATNLDTSYRADYAAKCGVHNHDGRVRQYAMMGVWDTSYTLNGVAHSATWYDTLGSYSSMTEFEQARGGEVVVREAIIKNYAIDRGWDDFTLSLVAVNPIPVTSQFLAKPQQ